MKLALYWVSGGTALAYLSGTASTVLATTTASLPLFRKVNVRANVFDLYESVDSVCCYYHSYGTPFERTTSSVPSAQQTGDLLYVQVAAINRTPSSGKTSSDTTSSSSGITSSDTTSSSSGKSSSDKASYPGKTVSAGIISSAWKASSAENTSSASSKAMPSVELFFSGVCTKYFTVQWFGAVPSNVDIISLFPSYLFVRGLFIVVVTKVLPLQSRCFPGPS